jgi:antitoxin VapB
MPLNIKDEKVHDLARSLADATGESMTQAVRVALAERLERERRRRGGRASAEELIEIGRRCAQHLKRAPIGHGDLLYDERGLPK